MTNIPSSNTTQIDLSKVDMAKTTCSSFCKPRDAEIEGIIRSVHKALVEKGYDPISQLVGYIMSGDPTYITSHKGARSLITKVERDEILEIIFRSYLLDN